MQDCRAPTVEQPKCEVFMYVSRKQILGFFIALALLAVYGLFGRLDADDQEHEQARYCYMVTAYNHDHNVGWPDYRHAYKDECMQGNGLATK